MTQPKVFGPFVLARPLGFGGAGDVWLAVYGQPGQEKVCVVKRLHRSLRDQPELIKRFRNEADLVRRLTHGAIAQTFLVGDVDGEPFIAQEFVDGQDLAQLAARLATAHEPLPVHIAVHVAAEVARALSYAHEFEGIALVHRDVSPENIRLAFTGEVKLLDFGIAKSAQRLFLTQAGHRPPGREMYMAPELLRGDRGDARADIFSLGIVLWGLLARSQLPSPEPSPLRVLPAPSKTNPDVPSTLDAIVAKATATAADDRYQTARDFQDALLTLLPHGFNGEAAVHDLLRQLFDVEREREHREEILSHARTLLSSVNTPTTGAPADDEPDTDPGSWDGSADEIPAGGDRRRRFIAVGVAALFAVTLVFLLTRSAPRPPRLRETPIVVTPKPVPPQAPAASVEAPPGPPPSAPLPSTTGPAPDPPPRKPVATLPKPVVRPAQPRPEQLVTAGWSALEDGQAGRAIELARAALRAGGGADARVLLGKALLAAGRLEDAEREISQAAREDPSNAKIRHAAEDLRKLREDSAR